MTTKRKVIFTVIAILALSSIVYAAYDLRRAGSRIRIDSVGQIYIEPVAGKGTTFPSGTVNFTGATVIGLPSADSTGVAWTSRTSAANNVWEAVTYGNGIFVAVSSGGTGNRVMTSPDGITWTSRTSAADNLWQAVTYGNGIFVAVSADGASRVMTSPDGITWTSRTSAANNSWGTVTYGNGIFVAVSVGGASQVMTSPDGITWTSRTGAADNDWRAVTYGNGVFVAVSADGASRVMTSGKALKCRATACDVAWTDGEHRRRRAECRRLRQRHGRCYEFHHKHESDGFAKYLSWRWELLERTGHHRWHCNRKGLRCGGGHPNCFDV